MKTEPIMDKHAVKALEDAGFAVEADAGDFLGLTPEERGLVELRRAVSRAVRQKREAAGLTQPALATKIGSSQSRVAKVESGAPGVSLDLAFKMFFAVGGRVGDLSPRGPAVRNRVTKPVQKKADRPGRPARSGAAAVR